MKKAIIPGGYYIKARKIQDSEIAKQPPHVREVWDWLIKEANHRDKGKFKRGQCLRTYKDIIDGLSWYVGYRKMSYTNAQCENALKWLTKHEMITKSKTTRGLIITICKYDLYQNPKNYESQNESDKKATRESQYRQTINKNVKNVKNDNNMMIPTFYDFQSYCKTLPIYHVSMGYQIEAKYNAWIENNWKDGNDKEIKNWKTKIQNTMPYFKINKHKENEIVYNPPK